MRRKSDYRLLKAETITTFTENASTIRYKGDGIEVHKKTVIWQFQQWENTGEHQHPFERNANLKNTFLRKIVATIIEKRN